MTRLARIRSLAVIAVGIVSWSSWSGSGVARAADAPADAPGAASGDVPKLECFSRHEEAQNARRERRLLQARAALRTCSRASCPAAIRADCVDWLEQVGRSLPSVVVTARARGADEIDVRVLVDGKLLAQRLSGGAMEIDPGEHRFRFESPRWPPIERTILVSEGVKDRPIDVEFAPATAPDVAREARQAPPPAAPRHNLDRFDYLVGGAAVAGAATWAYFGGSALLDRYRLTNDCAPFCNPADTNAVRTKLVVADVGLGVAVISLVVLYFHWAQSGPSAATAAAAPAKPWLAVDATFDGAGVHFGLRSAF